MTLFDRLVMWWWKPRNGAPEVDSGYPEHQLDDPVPDGFDLRGLAAPSSCLDMFTGALEDGT